MAERVFRSLGAAARAIEKDAIKREQRVRNAVRPAARQTRNYVARITVPRAFGELAESLHVVDGAPGDSSVVADAPHAAAVENGSRPHTPPLGPLIAWVTLRGIQGLTASGNVKSNRLRGGGGIVKDWRREAARSIALSLRGRLGRERAGEWQQHMSRLYSISADPQGNLAGADADPAVVEVARAIQRKIAREGTKPERFMGQAVGQSVAYLDEFVKEALPDR